MLNISNTMLYLIWWLKLKCKHFWIFDDHNDVQQKKTNINTFGQWKTRFRGGDKGVSLKDFFKI